MAYVAFLLKNDPTPCLINMGLLCLLDNDADLLAEVCICLKYIKADIPEYWKAYLKTYQDQIVITYNETVTSALNPAVDDYHVYFVLNWYQATQNKTAFETRFKSRTPAFSIPAQPESLLSKLSEHFYQYHFNSNCSVDSLEDFLSNVTKAEKTHWENIMASSDISHDLISQFAGL